MDDFNPDLIPLRSSLKKESKQAKYTIKANRKEFENYDFVKARKSSTKTINVFEAMAHMVKGAFGAGAVSIHESYKDCGLWTAVALNLILGVVVLVRAAHKMYGKVGVPQMTYPDLAEAALEVGPWQRLQKYGRCSRYIIETLLVVDLFGSCCVYQIVVGRALQQLVEGTDTVFGTSRNPYIRIYVGSLLLPCIILSMITSLKFMAPFSLVANLYMVVLALQTVKYGYTTATTSALDFPVFKSTAGLLQFLGVCVFSMEAIGATMPIENHVMEPKKFYLVVLGAMPAVTALVMVIGFFGCWGFGESASSPITINFPWESFAIVLKVFMILATYVTFTINFWVAFEVIWHHLKMSHAPAKYWLWERVYRAVFVVIITSVACALPNASKFIALLGCFCIPIMGLIYPVFIELSLDWEDPGLGFLRWRLWRFILIVVLSSVMLVYGTYSTARDLFIDVT